MTVELFNLYADRLRRLFQVKGPLDQLDQAVTTGYDRPADREAVEKAMARAEKAILKAAKPSHPPRPPPNAPPARLAGIEPPATCRQGPPGAAQAARGRNRGYGSATPRDLRPSCGFLRPRRRRRPARKGP